VDILNNLKISTGLKTGDKSECATSALFKYKEGARNCVKDEGRPLGTGLQEQVSNRLKLRW